MFSFTRSLTRRVGPAVLLLLTIAVTVPAAEAQACAPAEAAISVSVLDTAPASDDGCGDCTLSCAHGCCHASHVGILTTGPQDVSAAPQPVPVAWQHARVSPPAVIGGPERPPRA